MRGRLNFGVVVILLFSAVFSANLFGADALEKWVKMPAIGPSPQYAGPAKVPFYFPPGVIKTTDPVKQLQEYYRYLAATYYRFQGMADDYRHFISGDDSFSIVTDVDSTSSFGQGKTKMKVVLDHCIRMPDGKYRVTHLADQFIVTEEEVRAAADDLAACAVRAADDNYAFYGELSKLAVAARAKKLEVKPEDLVKILGDKEPLFNVTVRELNMLPPVVRKSDFIPRELHLGYNPQIQGILGLTWLNTGVIYLNPQARIVDYLCGRPLVLQHEMVHVNYNLEKFPFTSGFDTELLATIPEMFYDESLIGFFFHGYTRDMREITHSYFGFDFKGAKRAMHRFDHLGNLVIDEAKYREYDKKLTAVRHELLTVLKEKIIPEFYSDSLWWSAFHDALQDDNALYRLMMARYYNQTILGGSGKTAVWLEANRQKIMRIAKDAFDAAQNDEEGDGESITIGGTKISTDTLRKFGSFLSENERTCVRVYFKKNSDAFAELTKMSPLEAMEKIRSILRENGRKVVTPYETSR